MKNFKRNMMLDTDSYKNDHGRMLRDGTEYLYSAITPRKQNEFTSLIVVAGYQYLIKEYLVGQQITMEEIDEAEQEIEAQGYQFDRERWEYILNKHNGRLPLKIRAVPEGTVVPVGCPIVTIVNTDPKCAWLVSYVETMFLRGMWFMTTVASTARELKSYLSNVMFKHTGQKNIGFHVHNFGARGASSYEANGMSGMAHAMLFDGSDDLQSNRNIKHYYNTTNNFTSSVIASEHSVSCSNSDAEKNVDFPIAVKMLDILEQAVDRFQKTGKGVPVVSIVIDTYDAFRFVKDYLGRDLKDRVIELGKKGGKVVVRPDSGDPVEMPIRILEILLSIFGYTVNEQGYKVLPSYIGVIQGDGINSKSIRQICVELEKRKIALSNIVFGMGGKLTHPERGRDTFSFAMKASAQYNSNDGHWIDLFKNPITDAGKRSLKGRVTTLKSKTDNSIIADRIELLDINKNLEDMMIDVFLDGESLNESTFEEVRERANADL